MGERAEPDPHLLVRVERFLAGQDPPRTLLELRPVLLRRSSNRVHQLRGWLLLLVSGAVVFDGKAVV